MVLSSSKLTMSPASVHLASAQIVFGVGRGVGNREIFQRLAALAALVGAEVAGTRGAVDKGWLSREREIGMSGVRIQPKLYLAWGLSGSNFHTIGMERSEFIVAINPDPKARIHELSHISLLAAVEPTMERLEDYCRKMCIGPQSTDRVRLLVDFFRQSHLDNF